MRGLIGKFPGIFKKGYAVGWNEYESDEMDEEAGDMWGQHIRGLEEGLWQFAALLTKAGFETQLYDLCGCGDPLHLAVCFRADGVTMAVRIWDGIWRDEGSYDLKEDFCRAIAEGRETVPEDAWEVVDYAMDDEEWAAIMEGMMNNPSRGRTPRSSRSRHTTFRTQ